jgi:CheY-like chemotaxis protein
MTIAGQSMTGSAQARVVLIEDNPADVLLVREAIRERGLAVELISYADVPEAIAGLGNPGNPLPDAILMDLNLPRGEGMTIIKTLRASERLRDVPLAILTSSQSPRDLEQAQRLQVHWYIHKPSTLDEFLNTVGDAISTLLDSASHHASG